MENGAALLIYKPVDDKKWVPFAPHSRYIGWGGKEKDVHETRSEIGI